MITENRLTVAGKTLDAMQLLELITALDNTSKWFRIDALGSAQTYSG